MSNITKRALEDSLKHLLLKKPVNKITINDITEDCGVNRATFYYHFQDIYALIEWSCEEIPEKPYLIIPHMIHVRFDIHDGQKVAKRVELFTEGHQDFLDLTENDYLFITNGSNVENSSIGGQDKTCEYIREIRPGGSFDLWRKIAGQDSSFGHPEKFYGNPEECNWMGVTVNTLDGRILPYIKNICQRDPLSGKVVTGGIVTARDSGWLLSWTINRQPQFHSQPKDQCLVWLYGLFTNRPGDFVRKNMRDCTGKEICMEWLYHLGVPADQIEDLASNSARTIPVMMPFASAYFMPRSAGDRPEVVPDGAVNFAFLGNFAEVPRDTVFTTEYSIRTAMVAVYTLMNINRGVPEVWGSIYDVRDLLKAAISMRDGKPLTEMKLSLKQKIAVGKALDFIKGTDVEKLLKEYGVI